MFTQYIFFRTGPFWYWTVFSLFLSSSSLSLLLSLHVSSLSFCHSLFPLCDESLHCIWHVISGPSLFIEISAHLKQQSYWLLEGQIGRDIATWRNVLFAFWDSFFFLFGRLRCGIAICDVRPCFLNFPTDLYSRWSNAYFNNYSCWLNRKQKCCWEWENYVGTTDRVQRSRASKGIHLFPSSASDRRRSFSYESRTCFVFNPWKPTKKPSIHSTYEQNCCCLISMAKTSGRSLHLNAKARTLLEIHSYDEIQAMRTVHHIPNIV